MEKLIDISKLYSSLKDIIENKEDVEKVKEIIIQLHFSIQKIRLGSSVPEDYNFDSIEEIAIYLL